MASAELATELVYGGNLFLYAYSTYLLMISTKPVRLRIFYTCFGGLLLLLLTISFASNNAFCELMWIERQNYPGGTSAFLAANMAAWTMSLAQRQTTGLLLAVIVIPAIIYLGSATMASMMVIQSAMPTSDLWQGLAAQFGISWVALTVGFNIIVTALIIYRLGSPYTGIAEILVESALPFTVLGIDYLATYIQGVPSATAVGIVWGTFVVAFACATTLRIASGVAWSRDTASNITQTTPALLSQLIF
ncbi:hypothetical protein DFJ58DRAFT_819195 [Suillus subalutaceus]|uniref:uncharacterized protein n=1 Tax=Suillus subalutaceus TaxID=48586 RepID=UPI001B88711C|nr:uncharacterized protein DFJ58DRAFT_819195 [Suillus subalutaceus]KAG1836223.1 hypothetical protein DFJ58DRAFT_819195 [Suillus subalutaceus]